MKSWYFSEKNRPGTYLLVTPDWTSIRIKAGLTQRDFPANMLLKVVLLSHLPALLPFSTGAMS